MFQKRQYDQRTRLEAWSSDVSDDKIEEQLGSVPEELISAFTRLSETSQHPLFNNQPLGSHTLPPKYDSIVFSPVQCHGDLLRVETTTRTFAKAYDKA